MIGILAYWVLMGIGVGCWAVLFTGPLRDHGQVFSWFPAVWDRIISPAGRTFGKMNNAQQAAVNVGYLCPKCHAGQLALWSYFFLMDGYSFEYHFIFITAAIFTAYKLTE